MNISIKKFLIFLLIFFSGFATILIFGKFTNKLWYVSLSRDVRYIFSAKGKLRLKNSLSKAESNNEVWNYFREEIDTNWHVLNKDVFLAKKYLSMYYNPNPEFHGIPGGYFEYLNNNEILISNGKGQLNLFNIEKNKFKKIESNLYDIYLEQDFKGKIIPDLFGRFGIRDLFIDRKTEDIYASTFIDITGDGCYGIGIYKSDLKSFNNNNNPNQKLEFKEFFKTKNCNRDFNGHASGGRIAKLNEKIIFTVGSLDFNINKEDKSKLLPSKITQSKDTSIGKVISINKSGEFEVLSLGHRNHQGLVIIDNKIVISEHGPKGGDEINVVSGGKHYGWPYYSYGTSYKNENIFRNPHDGKFAKPIFYFNPAIAPSQLIFYEGSEFPAWKNKIILSSLKTASLHILDYDKDLERIISYEKVYIGHRIRDIGSLPNGKLVCITDDQNIILLSRSNINKIKESDKVPFLLNNLNEN